MASVHSPPEMAGERVKLKVQARDSRGSAESRRLREQGLIPGVLYGNGDKAHPFCIEERELRKALTGDHGLHAILDVILEGQQKAHHAVVKDYQLDPTRARLLRNRAASQFFQRSEGCHVSPSSGQIEYKMRPRN